MNKTLQNILLKIVNKTAECVVGIPDNIQNEHPVDTISISI